MADLRLSLDGEDLQAKIKAFKSDSEKMGQVSEFVEELLEKAQAEAEIRAKQKPKGKFENVGLENGTRRIGAWSNRARSSARTLASRVFTAICNCTNTVKSAVINRG